MCVGAVQACAGVDVCMNMCMLQASACLRAVHLLLGRSVGAVRSLGAWQPRVASQLGCCPCCC
jgi:hypothetical protein